MFGSSQPKGLSKWMRRCGEEGVTPAIFQYQQLDAFKREIRLVRIICAEETDSSPVHCVLYHTPLEDAGQFFALSYTWGDLARTKSIFIDGAKFNVTLNLEAFLRMWQSMPADRSDALVPLWIDAICINQDDMDERASQVNMMGNIYTNAELVLAWLGRREAYCERAFGLVEELSEVKETNDVDQVTQWLRKSISPLFSACAWMALADLLNRSWWRRAWIVQEMVLAEKVIVFCGDYALPYPLFTNATLVVFSHTGTMRDACKIPGRYTLLPNEALLASERFQRLADGAENVRCIAATSLLRFDDNNRESFYHMIRRHKWAEASDPRDRVYAYLGLALQRHFEVADLSVDYTVYPADLYRNLAKRHLLRRQDLSILNDCYGIGLSNEYATWAPFYKASWTLAGDLQSLDNPPHLEYCAASVLEPKIDFADDDEVLLLDVVMVDGIKQIGEVSAVRPGETIDGMTYTSENVSRSWRKLLDVDELFEWAETRSPEDFTDEQCDYIKRKGFYFNGQLKTEVWFRTMLCNPYADFQVNYVNTSQGFDAERMWTDRKCNPDGTNDDHLNVRLGRCCIGKRFFVTSKGYCGLGPPNICAGDVVCVPLGSKTPFLLRPCPGYYRIISESYVHGIMSGEIVQQLEKGVLKAEQIRLR